MSVIDLLLNANKKDFTMPTKKVEIKRLSELTGGKFEVTLKGLTLTQYETIQQTAVDFTTKQIDISTLQIKSILESTYDEEGKLLFKNGDLREKFGVVSNEDLVRTLLSGGEANKLYTEIIALSGFNKDAVSLVEKVKKK